MDVIVKAKNCEVPAKLREEAVERVEHAMRFFDRLTGVEMVFSEEQNPRIPEPAVVELTARSKGHHIRAEGKGADHRSAVEVAATRFESQLSRYKSRMVDRSRRHPRPQPASNGLIPEPVAGADGEDASPQIVRTKQFELVPMSPEEAAWQLELLGHDFHLFRNDATGDCSLLYRRKDGNLGLIEPLT